MQEADLPHPLLACLFMRQAQLVQAPVLLVLSAEFDRSMKKYGERAYRHVLLEAGHVMQNLTRPARR